jgi:energy-converting hydrogenase A subunit M
MSMQRKPVRASTSASASFCELYAAHERMEQAATRFVRVLVEADRSGLKGLARFAEQCAQRCIQGSLLLEEEIRQRL